MSAAQSIIAAMITPALLILASASLVATVLVRLARVVDRVRKITESAESKNARAELQRQERRAQTALWAVALLFSAIVCFVLAGIAIAADHAAGGTLLWLPVGLTLLGMCGIVAAAALMVVESVMSLHQIRAEIAAARERLSDR